MLCSIEEQSLVLICLVIKTDESDGVYVTKQIIVGFGFLNDDVVGSYLNQITLPVHQHIRAKKEFNLHMTADLRLQKPLCKVGT